MSKADDQRVPGKRIRKRLMVRFGPDAPGRTAFTGNVSENGLHLSTNYVFPPGTVLQVEVIADNATFAMVGRVVWVKKVPPRLAQVRSSSMGLYFQEPGPDWRDFVRDWVAHFMPSD